MQRVRVIPILLISGGGLVKTIRFKKPNYIGDPINAVRIYNDKEVDELAILDIDATVMNKAPNLDKIRDIVSEAFMPVAYGGGIQTIDQARQIFDVGVEKLIVNTIAYKNPKVISEIAAVYGSQSIAVSVDVRHNLFGRSSAYSKSGKAKIPLKLSEYIRQIEANGAGEIILTSIDREGTFQGYDIDLIELVSKLVDIPVVANGGSRDMNDFYAAVKAGASAVAAGSQFVYSSAERGIMINYPKQQLLTSQLYAKLNLEEKYGG